MTNEDVKKSYEDMKKNVMSEVRELFRPEFIKRIDEIIVFHPIEMEDAKQIARIMLNDVEKRLKENMEMQVEFTEQLVAHIAEIGFDQNYGARPLRRTIQTKIEDPLAEKILENQIDKQKKILIDYKDERIVFEN